MQLDEEIRVFNIQGDVYRLYQIHGESGDYRDDEYYFKKNDNKMEPDEIAGGNSFETESGACWALLNNFAIDNEDEY